MADISQIADEAFVDNSMRLADSSRHVGDTNASLTFIATCFEFSDYLVFTECTKTKALSESHIIMSTHISSHPPF